VKRGTVSDSRNTMIESGPDTTSSALEMAKANAHAAMKTIARIMVMQKPPRNAVAQLAAARQVLELAGLGSGDSISHERLIKALRAELEPAVVLRVVKRLTG
jgi:hypothetical protein